MSVTICYLYYVNGNTETKKLQTMSQLLEILIFTVLIAGMIAVLFAVFYLVGREQKEIIDAMTAEPEENVKH